MPKITSQQTAKDHQLFVEHSNIKAKDPVPETAKQNFKRSVVSLCREIRGDLLPLKGEKVQNKQSEGERALGS